MTDLPTLIKKLEEAEEGSHALDVEIYCRVYGSLHEGPHSHGHPVPAYTTSLDAIVGLVESELLPLHPGMTVTQRVIYGARGPYCYAEITWPSHERQGRAKTAPLALCLAFARALQQREG